MLSDRWVAKLQQTPYGGGEGEGGIWYEIADQEERKTLTK